MVSKKTDKNATVKTYNSIRGLLVAKAAGALPRGLKADHSINGVTFAVGDVIVFSIDTHDFVEASLKRLGFTVAK
jgi:hypothetical protein